MHGKQAAGDIAAILARLPFPVGLFGSCLHKPYRNASDIDMVVENPGRHMRRLKALSRRLGKPLDMFMPPLMEEERTSKMYITPDGEVTKDCVYCGKGFFDGIILIKGSCGNRRTKQLPRQTKSKGERHG